MNTGFSTICVRQYFFCQMMGKSNCLWAIKILHDSEGYWTYIVSFTVKLIFPPSIIFFFISVLKLTLNTICAKVSVLKKWSHS